MEDNIRVYLSRLRQLKSDIRHASSATPSSDTRSTPDSTRHAATGLRPFIERLKPPTFSGKIEDWPEFRSVWTELLAEYPENVQVQHLREHIPETDKKRIVGVKTMGEIWRRLEKVYGNTELNIITVKMNLENLVPKATQDFKRILLWSHL